MLQAPITLLQAGIVLVRVNDPGQLLSAHEGRTPGAQLLIGISDKDRAFYRASVSARDTAGRSYRLLVPVDRQHKLTVDSNYFHMVDSNNVPLPALAAAIPVFLPSSLFAGSLASTQQTPTIVLTVSEAGK